MSNQTKKIKKKKQKLLTVSALQRKQISINAIAKMDMGRMKEKKKKIYFLRFNGIQFDNRID